MQKKIHKMLKSLNKLYLQGESKCLIELMLSKIFVIHLKHVLKKSQQELFYS